MRYKIWEKDDFFNIGSQRIDMDPAVVSLSDERLALVWSYNFENKPLGWVTDVRLEDGEISGEVEWVETTLNDEVLKDLEVRFGGYYKNVTKNMNASVVVSCDLVAVSLVHKAYVPGYSDKREGGNG